MTRSRAKNKKVEPRAERRVCMFHRQPDANERRGSRLGRQVRITCSNAKLSSDVFQRATPSDRVQVAI